MDDEINKSWVSQGSNKYVNSITGQTRNSPTAEEGLYPEAIFAIPMPKFGFVFKLLGRGGEAAFKEGSNLAIRSDIALSGGRSGQLVKTLEGPANSVLKGGQGRVFSTNDAGKVIWDVTTDRAKSVVPGQGFGPKVAPTQEQLNLLKQVRGN